MNSFSMLFVDNSSNGRRAQQRTDFSALMRILLVLTRWLAYPYSTTLQESPHSKLCTARVL
ncbi:hypothetical protein KC19_5G153900 [Ceratodon purpureus]|uniref:Uncharacterized protein n=1 Tax=Ceratodon purpureus TaxID=3225 RepID=A0A8T0I378_CERPU|nr:hypothetical protein KC19_5G153900 [Ceratodon purpureus]